MPFVTLRAPDTAAPAARFAALNGFQLFSTLFSVSLAGVTMTEDLEESLPAWAEVRFMTKTTMTLIAVATLYWERMTMLLKAERIPAPGNCQNPIIP
jgi:hypothetical protein